MRSNSLTIGRFFGIQLRIHYSWIVIFALVTWTVITAYLPAYSPALPLPMRILVGVIVTLLLFASIVAHEFAHSLVARHRGLEVNRITLFLFGGVSELQHEPTTAKTELLMTVAGPLTSLTIAGLFWALWGVSSNLHLTILATITELVAILNLVVGLFNLVPAYPLDGGRIFRSLVWLKTKDVLRATKIASYGSYVIAYLMIALGFLEIVTGNVVGGVWLGVLGYFLHQTTRLSYLEVLRRTQPRR